MAANEQDFETTFRKVADHILERYNELDSLDTLPPLDQIAKTVASLPLRLPEKGLGTAGATAYLLDEVLPGCLPGQPGPRYYGFVTGGVTPAAQIADMLTTSYDENVQMTLPGATASTAVEARTLELVLDLLDIPRENYAGRTITTGATASNVLGMACARDYLYSFSPHLPAGYSYSQDGPPVSPILPSPPIIILSLYPHFSVTKAAGLVGIGAGPRVVHAMPAAADDELAFDLEALRTRLQEEKKVGRGVIVNYGLGEVNTGGFGRGVDQVAALCNEHGAWLHIDAAFGGFAALVPELRHLTKGMEMADSLTLDGHKWLNVPYDCGLFFTRHAAALARVFAPATAPAYLSSSASTQAGQGAVPGQIIHSQVPNPLYCNIENSRRFRALPLFASLLSLGRDGYRDIIQRNIEYARRVARYISDSPHYELLNPSPPGVEAIVPLNTVLFRGSMSSKFSPNDEGSSGALTEAINRTRRIYVTGTRWRGAGAIRLAVSNWRTGLNGDDFEEVKSVLERVMQ